jgi:hypothetical protein
MGKKNKINLLDIKDIERMKLAWEINRQIQQKILQKKLTQCLLKPQKGLECLQRYPEAMQPMIKDLMKKVEERTKPYYV